MVARRLGIAVAAAISLASAVALANQNQERRERDEQRNDRGGLEEAKTVERVAFSTKNGQIIISSVIVMATTDRVLGFTTDIGLRREDVDRLDLGGIPLIGGLFGGGSDDDEEGPEDPVRIGTAYFVGNSLAIDLGGLVPAPSNDVVDAGAASGAIEARIAEAMSAPAGDFGLDYEWDGERFTLTVVKILNGNYSYSAPAIRLVPIGGLVSSSTTNGAAVPMLGDVPLVGSLFRHRAGDAYLERSNLVVLVKPSILAGRYE